MSLQEVITQHTDGELAEWAAAASTDVIISALKIGRIALGAAAPPPPTLTSTAIGKAGEIFVQEILREKFGTVINTSRVNMSGDLTLFHTGNKIMIEVKNYKSTVPSAEVEKFSRDLDTSAAAGGVFVSLGSRICGIPSSLHTRYESTARGAIPSIFIQSGDPDLIAGAVSTCIKMAALVRESAEFSANSAAFSAKIGSAAAALSSARHEIGAAAGEITRRLLGSVAGIARCESVIGEILADSLPHGVTPLDPFVGNEIFLRYPTSIQEETRRAARILAGESSWRITARKASCTFGCINFLVSGPTIAIPRTNIGIDALVKELGADFSMSQTEFILSVSKKSVDWLASIRSDS